MKDEKIVSIYGDHAAGRHLDRPGIRQGTMLGQRQ